MTIQTGKVLRVAGVTGTDTSGGARTAVADRVVIGKTEIRNVPFLVLRDDQQPFAAYPLEERGIIGLPVLLAIKTLRWNRQRQLTIGFDAGSESPGSANLCFEGADPLAEIEVQGHHLAFMLDTGGEDSELWPPFAREFPALVDRGTTGAKELSGFTGTKEVDAAILPELRVKLSGFEMAFLDAPVLLKNTVPSSRWHYGRIGMDLLNQANEVIIDFRAMKIVLR